MVVVACEDKEVTHRVLEQAAEFDCVGLSMRYPRVASLLSS